jgi:hypothetical protein
MNKEVLAMAAEEAGIDYGTLSQGDTDIPSPDVVPDELGNLSIQWLDPAGTSLELRVSNLETKRDALSCLLTVRKKDGSGAWKWVLAPRRINLLSSTAMTQLRRELDNSDKRFDWHQRLDQVVIACYQSIRSSSKAVDLSTVTPTKTAWLAAPLLERGEHTVLFAEGGLGKSLIALALAVQCATGKKVLPAVEPPETPTKVLYLDWETGADVHKRRLDEICAGLGMTAPQDRLYYWRMEFALREAFADIRQFIAQNQIGLVVIDSAALAANGDVNESATGTDYIKAVRELGDVATLTITHVSKATLEKDRLRPIGSVYFQNGPRSSWGLVGEQDELSDTKRNLGLVHVKSNNSSLKKPLSFTLDFSEPEQIKFQSGSVYKSDSVARHLSKRDRILNLLTHGRYSLDSITDELPDVPYNTVKATVNRLVKSGHAMQMGKEYVAVARSVAPPTHVGHTSDTSDTINSQRSMIPTADTSSENPDTHSTNSNRDTMPFKSIVSQKKENLTKERKPDEVAQWWVDG